MAEGEQALHRRHRAIDRRRFQARLDKLVRILLEVAEGDPVQRLLDRFEEPLGVGPVRPLGVSASTVEPEVDQMLIGFGLLRDDKGGRRPPEPARRPGFRANAR